MTSSINPNNIDGTYPIAGQDNDSQGFRDNFTNIKNNLTFAATELSDLQTNAVLIAPLTSVGQTSVTNNMGQTPIVAAQLSQTTQTVYNLGTVNAGSNTIDWTNGAYQVLSTPGTGSGTITLTFNSTWPTVTGATLQAVMKLRVIVNSTSFTLAIDPKVNININSIQNAVNNIITFPATGIYEYEFSTYNTGANISIRDTLNNYDNVSSDFSIGGNLTTKGARIVGGYQLTAPAANAAVTIGNNVERLIITPTTISTPFGMVVTLPNANVDATTVSISSNVAIAGLQVNPNAGTVLLPSANIALSAGSASTFFFHATESKWYKIG